MTNLRLTISDPASGRSAEASARLLEERSPATTERFGNACPIDATLRHVRWSGEAGYVLIDDLRDPSVEVENGISSYCRGTITFRPEHGEVTIAYGSAQARDWWGIGWATPVAELIGDADAFLALVRDSQRTGVKQLRIDLEDQR